MGMRKPVNDYLLSEELDFDAPGFEGLLGFAAGAGDAVPDFLPPSPLDDPAGELEEPPLSAFAALL